MPRKLRIPATYAALVVLPTVLVVWLLARAHLGPGGLVASEATASGSAPVQVWRFLLALAVIIAVARLVGSLAALVRQPRVIGEMVSGILLGPSLLGLIAPEAYTWLFGPGVLQHVQMFSQLGLTFFMFLVGLELDHDLVRGRGWSATAIGQVSVAVPLLLGVATGLAMYGELGRSESSRGTFALFIGVAMSVTAFPVLARILMERGMFQMPVGSLAMVCAAMADVIAWLLLALVAAEVRSDSAVEVLRVAFSALVLLVVMVGIVRPLLRRLLTSERRWAQEGGASSLALVGVLLAAVAADWIGIHLIFGAFLFGAICPRNAPKLQAARRKIEDLTLWLLLPPFFAVVGLQTQIGLIGANMTYWLWFGLLVVVAVVGKWAATTVGALGVGVDGGTAIRLGVLMNCKGLTELVILTVGLQLGILTPRQFTILVLVALVVTIMTTPLLALLDRIDRPVGPDRKPAVPAPPSGGHAGRRQVVGASVEGEQ